MDDCVGSKWNIKSLYILNNATDAALPVERIMYCPTNWESMLDRMTPNGGTRFCKGLAFALVAAIPFWASLAALALT